MVTRRLRETFVLTLLILLSSCSLGLNNEPYKITITSPNGGETWKIGSKETITWTLAGIPPETYKLHAILSNMGEGFIGSLEPTSGEGTIDISWISYGDTGTTIKPGEYKLLLKLYDGTTYDGTYYLAHPDTPQTKVIAQDESDGLITIEK